MNELSLYEKARTVLAEYKTIDQVKDFRDKAMAVRVYAQQAKDTTLEHNAIEARMRAERRLGEMMEEMEKAKGAIEPGTSRGTTRVISQPASLASQGIDKNLAHTARKLAKMPAKEFEAHIEEHFSSARYNRPSSVAQSFVEKLDKQESWLAWYSGKFNPIISQLSEEKVLEIRNLLVKVSDGALDLIKTIDTMLSKRKEVDPKIVSITGAQKKSRHDPSTL